MSNQVKWNKELLEQFKNYALLDEEESRLMEYRVINKYTMQKQADLLGVGIATANRMTKRCKLKYDVCHKMHPEIFEERKFENVWKSNNIK